MLSERVYFYYFRDASKKPVVTVCLLKDEAGFCHRGISICSFKDNPRKSTGRKISFRRAKKAYLSMCSNLRDKCNRKEVTTILKTVSDFNIPLIQNKIMKSDYNCRLTDFEKCLVKEKRTTQ